MSYDFKSNASREYLENIIDLNHITIIHLSGTTYDPDVVNIQKKLLSLTIIINLTLAMNFVLLTNLPTFYAQHHLRIII